MPLYTVLCSVCARRDSVFRKIADRDDALPSCCDTTMQRIIEPPMVRGEIEPYESPVRPGTMINSRAQQREDLARSHCFLAEPGVRQDVERNRQYKVERSNEFVADLVDNTVRDFAVSGRL